LDKKSFFKKVVNKYWRCNWCERYWIYMV